MMNLGFAILLLLIPMYSFTDLKIGDVLREEHLNFQSHQTNVWYQPETNKSKYFNENWRQSESIQPIYDDYWDLEGDPSFRKPDVSHIRDDSDLYNPALFDLRNLKEDFILKTKEIVIPGYPGAFNPSIVRWQGSLLLSFRTRAPITATTNETNGIGLVWLDEEFNPISTPQILSISYRNFLPISKQQDPRLIQVGNRLFMVYNNVIKPQTHPELRRIYYVELIFDGISFHPTIPQVITDYPYRLDYRQEKNWIPFDYQDHLFLSYTIAPHRVFYPIPNTSSCALFTESSTPLEWDWGALRGGTPALLVDGQYLAFFHSSINLPTLHSNGKIMLHYFMGAYTFSATPPFKINKISKKPIVADTFYTGPPHKTWKPLRVVFPGGYVFDESSIWIVYGQQDFEMWVVQIDKQKLLSSLSNDD